MQEVIAVAFERTIRLDATKRLMRAALSMNVKSWVRACRCWRFMEGVEPPKL